MRVLRLGETKEDNTTDIASPTALQNFSGYYLESWLFPCVIQLTSSAISHMLYFTYNERFISFKHLSMRASISWPSLKKRMRRTVSEACVNSGCGIGYKRRMEWSDGSLLGWNMNHRCEWRHTGVHIFPINEMTLIGRGVSQECNHRHELPYGNDFSLLLRLTCLV